MIFVSEAGAKIYAFGWVPYIQNRWNKFDFVVVILSIADFVMSEFTVISSNFLTLGPQLIKIIRVFRVSRLFQLLKNERFTGIKKIIKTIRFAFYSFIELFGFYCVVFIIYAVLGVFMFKDIKRRNDFNNEWFNFSHFGWAIMTLFRCSTGED